MVRFEPGGLAQFDSPERQGGHERPRDHTAVRMIDEFEHDGDAPDEPRYVRNVLLMAYRAGVEGSEALAECRRWS